jgi:hypothetical protein
VPEFFHQIYKTGWFLLAAAAIRTIVRALTHQALTILATDLGTGLTGSLLWCGTIALHWLAVTGGRWYTIGRIRIVSRITRLRTISLGSITLRNPVALRHVSRLLLRHRSGRGKCNLCLTGQVRPSVDLQHRFQTVLHRGSPSCGAAYWHSNAERKSLSRTFAEILGPSDLDISRIEDVLSTFRLLESLIIQSDPNHFLPGLEDPGLYNDPFALNVLVGFNIYFANNCFTLCKSRLVETDPDFTLWRY